MMTTYNFNGRLFCVKREHLLQREQRIYDLLVEDYDERIVYPYEVETSDGSLATRWRHLTTDEVTALLDNSDERQLVQRVDWSDQHIQIDGQKATVKRIAPAAYFTLTCTLLDEGMLVQPFDVYLPVEDFVALMLRIMDSPSYGLFNLQMPHPVTYQRIMDKCPQSMSKNGRIVFSTAQEILAQSKGFGKAGDEVSSKETGKNRICHVVATISEKSVEFYEETAEDFDINPIAEITVVEMTALCRVLGVYNANGLFQAFETMLKGSDGTLAPIKAFLTDHDITYALKEYE